MSEVLHDSHDRYNEILNQIDAARRRANAEDSGETRNFSSIEELANYITEETKTELGAIHAYWMEVYHETYQSQGNFFRARNNNN